MESNYTQKAVCKSDFAEVFVIEVDDFMKKIDFSNDAWKNLKQNAIKQFLERFQNFNRCKNMQIDHYQKFNKQL